MPVPQSAKAVLFDGHAATGSEGWEWTVAWWYPTSFLLICGILGFEPETDIATWARQEAAARLALKEAGQVTQFTFGKHYQSLSEEDVRKEWDAFNTKSMRMNDDDDDDDADDNEEDDEE